MGCLRMQSSVLLIFLTFFCIYEIFVTGQYTNFDELVLPPGVVGPESAAFRPLVGDGPFTTVTDGRILKWLGPSIGFVDFAYTSPERTKEVCDGTTDPDLGPICGRPIALSFHPLTGLLYIGDAYFGVLVVGPLGGLATQLAGGFKFVAGIDVNLLTGDVYFSDVSLTYNIRDTTLPGFQPDSTGRFLVYNQLTKQVSVLLSGLNGGGGPAVSSDGTFVLLPELQGSRILKYWLVGPNANMAEHFIDLDGNPNKIKRAERAGEFWVAMSSGYIPPTPLITPQGVRLDSDGVVLQTVSFATQYFNRTISLVQEQNGKLYVGSRISNFIGVYSN